MSILLVFTLYLSEHAKFTILTQSVLFRNKHTLLHYENPFSTLQKSSHPFNYLGPHSTLILSLIIS